MRIVCCIICESAYDEGDQCAIEGKHSGALYGVCPVCRRHAAIGKRVEGMKPAKYPEGEGADMRYEEIDQADGYNRCLREAKGEKP